MRSRQTGRARRTVSIRPFCCFVDHGSGSTGSRTVNKELNKSKRFAGVQRSGRIVSPTKSIRICTTTSNRLEAVGAAPSQIVLSAMKAQSVSTVLMAALYLAWTVYKNVCARSHADYPRFEKKALTDQEGQHLPCPDQPFIGYFSRSAKSGVHLSYLLTYGSARHQPRRMRTENQARLGSLRRSRLSRWAKRTMRR